MRNRHGPTRQACDILHVRSDQSHHRAQQLLQERSHPTTRTMTRPSHSYESGRQNISVGRKRYQEPPIASERESDEPPVYRALSISSRLREEEHTCRHEQ